MSQRGRNTDGRRKTRPLPSASQYSSNYRYTVNPPITEWETKAKGLKYNSLCVMQKKKALPA
jgi:hypothetical protein